MRQKPTTSEAPIGTPSAFPVRRKRPKQRTAEPKFKGEMRGQHSKRNAMDGMEKGRKRWKKALQGFRIQRAIF